MDADTDDLRHSPLDAAHRALGARMVPFGGWEMPLAYAAGTLAEHRACRTAAVAFDVSHLGTVRVEGPGAFDALQAALTNDLRKVEPGRCQYTHLLADDGGVLDDIIVWWVDAERFDVMPNASNTARVLDALGAATAQGVTMRDVTAERAIVAVQGPTARSLVAAVLPAAADIGRFRVSRFDFDGTECLVAGTGYTGEDGIEIAVPTARAEELWRAVLSAGIEPAGLGARDTLRLEAGLPLHGHELGPAITTLNAGLGWVVGWDKGDFRGRVALANQREAGVRPILRGIVTDGRRPPREGAAVLVDGRRVGEVSSGNFSPMLDQGIALAFVEPELTTGDAVVVEVRGTQLTGRIVDLPFVGR